jgi:putative peptidoglycan lipid II flippase
MTQSRALSNTQIIRAALVVLMGFLASGVLGFIRQGVLAAQFGTTHTLDAFVTAQRIPEIIFVLVAGGALGSSFIPIYAKRREEDEAAAWRLASAVMTLAAIAAAILGLVTAIFADVIVAQVLLRDSTPDIQQLTTNMMRLMMITPFIFAISGLVMGILQSHGLFLLPAIAVSMNSIGIIFGALFLAPNLPADVEVALVGNNNVYGLAYGAILSALLHLLVQIPGLLRIKARLQPLPDTSIPGVLEVLRLMGPRVLGLAIVQVNFVVNIILADSMVGGSLAALSVAFTLMFTVLGIIGQSVGSAVFPTLSALYAEGNIDGFRQRLASAMRSVLFLSYPAMVAFIVLGQPIVSIFERNEWTAESTAATAWALSFYATGIAGFALLEVLSRAFYALADTWTPVVVGIGAMVSNIILSLIFIRFIGEPDSLARGSFAGLALANALTTLIEALMLWYLMRRRIGGLQDTFILDGSWRALVAALIMGLMLWAMRQISPVQDFRLALAGAAIGGAVFFGTSLLLGLDEAKLIPNILLRRFKR